MPTYGVAIFPSYRPDEFSELCAHVDALGFDHLWLPDERFFRDLGVELTLAALSTRRVRIGTAVTDPYIRHPAITACMTASADEVAGGRLTVGIGAGISGFKALGIRQERPQLAIREAVQLMRALWRKDGPVDLEGKTTTFHGAELDFTPLRRELPVWIAGRGPAVLSLAGEIADGVMIGGLASEPGLRYADEQISRGLAKAGRKPNQLTRSIWLHTGVAPDGERARAAVRTIVAGVLVSSLAVLREIGIPLSEELIQSLEGVTYGVNNPEMRRIADSLTDDVLRHFSVAGTPSEVGERLRELGSAGIDHVAVVPWLAEDQTLRQFLDQLAEAAK